MKFWNSISTQLKQWSKNMISKQKPYITWMKVGLLSELLRPQRLSLIHALLKLQHIIKHNEVGKNDWQWSNVFVQMASSFHFVSSKQKISTIIGCQPIHLKTGLLATILKIGQAISMVLIGYGNVLSFWSGERQMEDDICLSAIIMTVMLALPGLTHMTG